MIKPEQLWPPPPRIDPERWRMWLRAQRKICLWLRERNAGDLWDTELEIGHLKLMIHICHSYPQL